MHKKNLILNCIIIVLLFILIFFVNIVYSVFSHKLSLESYVENLYSNNISDIFKIDKIVLFSTCDSDSIINSNSTTTINNLSQFTDIAIFINNSTTDFTLKNTLKSVSIKDISFNEKPSLGTPNLYYKSLNDFATSKVNPDNIINNSLDFSISSDNEIDYSNPILFNNCANPITLSYVNSKILDNYTLSNTNNSLTHDGSLLKNCNIVLNDLSCTLSFSIYIENNLGNKFKCPIYLKIPLSNESNSIYDGTFTYTYNPNYSFFLYEF